MKTIVILWMVFSIISADAQVMRRSIAAPYTGLGAYSIHHPDLFSFLSNQACLAQLKSASAGIYGERKFFLAELNSYTAGVAFPTHSGNFGLKANYAGSSEYNETQVGLAYARRLGAKMDIGVQFNYNGILISNYGNAAAISFETGIIFHLTGKLHTGLHLNNPVGGRFGKTSEEKLPAVYTFGWGYDASENFFFSVEIIKEEDQPVNVNAGLQYKFISRLLARVGISSATSSIWTGLGLLWKSLRIDVTSSFHPQLGITPGLLFLFNFTKKEN